MALSFGDVASLLPKVLEFGGSFAAPSREGPDLGFLRDAIAKREGYVDKMIAPPPEIVAAEEAEMRRAQIQRMNQLLAGLRRGVRRGGPTLVDRERMDDLGKFIRTPGPEGRDLVRSLFSKAAGVPVSPLAAQLGQTAQTGRRSDFLNRLGFGAGLLGDVLRQGQLPSQQGWRGALGLPSGYTGAATGSGGMGGWTGPGQMFEKYIDIVQ